MRSSGGLPDGVLDAGLCKDDVALLRHMVAETMRGIQKVTLQVQRMGCERTQKRVFRCRPVGKKRQPGGVSLRWVDPISRYLSWIQDWTNVVTDR